MTLAEAPAVHAARRGPARGGGLLGLGRPWLADLIRPRRGRIAALVALGLAAAAAGLVPPYLTKLVIDQGLVARDAGALVYWALMLLGFGFATLALGAATSVLHMRASVDMLADLRALLARTILARSPAWRAEHTTGELMARLDGDAGEVQQFAFNALLTGTGASLRLVGGAAMLFVLDARLAAIALALAPLELVFFWKARPRTEALARAARAEKGALASRLAEMVQGLGQIQAARGEVPVAAAIGGAQARLNRALVRSQLWGEATRAVPQVLSALARSAVFIAGGLMVIRGELSLGALIAFLAYLGFLIGPVQSLIGLWHARARLQAALERLDGVMTASDGPVWPMHPLPLPDGPGDLRLEGLALRQGDRALLRDLTLDIPAGTRLRLLGASGAGKTSLLALLQRHADPDAGRILLDGADLRALDRDALRRAVAYVPQRPFLIRGSVAENLALSAPDAAPAAMAAMLDLVGLTARFAPAGGLDADLGENGLTLSGGERQRLCLARTLLAPFRILVLDEALSEVDPATARRIMAAIDARFASRTRIVATHGAEASHGPFDAVLDLDARP